MGKEISGKTDRQISARPLADSFGTAAFGGQGWSGRTLTHGQEIGGLWADCGMDTEWQNLKSVLVHRPGKEMEIPKQQVNELQFAEALDLGKAREEHEGMVNAYQKNGVKVHFLEPNPSMTPNQIFCADLFAMTPEGAILARPASTVRAGEERWVAQTLANLGIPILKTLTGTATFEGADLMWLDPETAVIGRGLRTNSAGIDQISSLLNELGITTLAFDLPYGTMHFMGMLRMVKKDLAFVWPRRTPHGLVLALRERGVEVLPLPDLGEAVANMAFNFVVLGPGRIMLGDKNPKSIAGYEALGIECTALSVDELRKANGAMGCMTGILERKK
ncbi:dimethylarginine dimethylaminohydrolase family protein [Desulfospira joergensenii]|uniref:dimethylarginine dimethylaminohydrolase family protein n=1 Tax=Desulfospira joergensenii TaxID=53329 RepID=UPI0003B65B2B|nr:arginine deiminase family protein [Desulfospira joergensenii]